MPVVIDANLLVVLASRDPRAGAVERLLEAWFEAGEELYAPTLLPYEVASGLTRLSTGGLLPATQLAAAWALVQEVPVRLEPVADGLEIIQTALRLHRSSAYDAAYVVLAQQLGAALWTLDGHLARNAASLGLPVQLVD